MRRTRRYALFTALLLIAAIFIGNTSQLANRPAGKPLLLAHRGIAQRFDPRGVEADTCTATRMLPSAHRFIENTLPSMRASFAAGADIAELDVHPTTDGRFAVFHDWTLDCRTDGAGVTREHSLAELKALDVGYGYTGDNGLTFPLCGHGIGIMPALDEVLAAFPDGRFVINIKSNDPREGEMLAAFLHELTPQRRAQLFVYGGDQPVDTVKRLLPDMRTMSKRSLVACITRYIAYGWTGIMPPACETTIILVPLNIAPWLWGWPDRFLDRFDSAGTAVFVVGPYHGGDFSTGVDTLEELGRLPAGYSGGIWTDEIEVVGKALRKWRN